MYLNPPPNLKDDERIQFQDTGMQQVCIEPCIHKARQPVWSMVGLTQVARFLYLPLMADPCPSVRSQWLESNLGGHQRGHRARLHCEWGSLIRLTSLLMVLLA